MVSSIEKNSAELKKAMSHFFAPDGDRRYNFYVAISLYFGKTTITALTLME